MREKVQRKFWQIHFSTALALMMTCAFLLGFNLTRARKTFTWPEGVYTTYGWPFDACLLRGEAIQKWNYFGITCDLVGAIAIIALIAVVCEWFTRFQLYERAPRCNRMGVLKPKRSREQKLALSNRMAEIEVKRPAQAGVAGKAISAESPARQDTSEQRH